MIYPLPGTTIGVMKRLIKTYSIYQESVVTSLAIREFNNKIQNNDATSNSEFFVSTGLLEKTEKSGAYRITNTCKTLGKAYAGEPDSRVQIEQIWKKIAQKTPLFNELMRRIELEHVQSLAIKKNDLKDIILSLSRYKNKDRDYKNARNIYSQTIIHILMEIKFISKIDDDTYKLYRTGSSSSFISNELVDQFTSLKVRKFSLKRLIHYCEQINRNYELGYYESVAFTTRALMDHVPPIFNQPNFESIGSKVGQGKTTSFKKSCDKLHNSLKHIVDDLIHKQISAGTSLLVKEEIDFSQDLNTFLRRTLEELEALQKQDK